MKQQDFDRLKAICENEGFEYEILPLGVRIVGKKLPKRIEVKRVEENIDTGAFYFDYDEDAVNQINKLGKRKVSKFLAKQLEKYLNGEVE